MTSIFRNLALGRFALVCVAVFSSLMLTACGGSGGTVGITTGTALFTTAPSAITIAAGPSGAASYSIGGGTPIYSAHSSSPGTATVSIVGNGATLTISGVASGSTQIIITDAKGASVAIAVTVTGGSSTVTALFTTAPSDLTVAVGATSTYTIGGGVPAYIVSSSNNGVARVGINGNSFIITGVAAGSAQIVVFDASGTSVAVRVTVGSGGTATALYTTAANAVTIAPGGVATYTIGGGAGPYTATSSNTGVAQVVIAGTALTVTGIGAGTAKVLVFDSTGVSVTIDVSVGSVANVTALYTTAASAVTIAVDGATTYSVGGGIGPYTATSSNTGVVGVSLSGATLIINGVAAGSAQVLVFDSTGVSVTIAVTVSQAASTVIDVLPNDATGNVGDVLQFLVSGGSPGYTLTVNNSSIATVTPTTVGASGGSFSATLLNVGSTVVTIVDARGQSKNFTITVSQLSTLLRVSPSALLVAENSIDAIDLKIYGGTGPYRAFTSDQTLSSVSIAGSTLTVALGSKGNRCINPVTSDLTYIPNGTFDVTITAVDSLGASATGIMTIKDNGAGMNAGCP